MTASRLAPGRGVDSELVKQITIPIFSGVIGYIINWTGVWMLFHPVRFWGFRVPGLAAFASLLPRKLQEIPGIMHGGVGWQGIVPNRSAKMGSIAVDKGIAKLGSAGEFYNQLEPDKIAEHILATSQRDIRDVVERIMQREHASCGTTCRRASGRPFTPACSSSFRRSFARRRIRSGRTSTSCWTSS